MSVIWRPVDPNVPFMEIISALARKDCAVCNGTGIQPGDEYPRVDQPRLIHQRDSDRPCPCIPRLSREFGETVIIFRSAPPEAMTYETATYPDLNIEVLQ